MPGPPTTRRVNGDGISLNVAIWKGAGKPVICLHGITANCRSWDTMAASLGSKHHLIALDLRGRGKSDKPPSGYSLEHHLRDIYNLMDGLGLQRAVLMGHSLGAFISLVFAAQHPELTDRLILIDGGGKLSPGRMDNILIAIKPALERLGKVFPSPEAYLEAMKQTPYINPWSESIEEYYRYEIVEVEGGVQANLNPDHIKEEADNIRRLDPAEYYSKVKCETLIIRATEGLAADDDLLLPDPVLKLMIKSIPRSRVYDVSGLNHFGLVFQPHQGRDRAILSFLEE